MELIRTNQDYLGLSPRQIRTLSHVFSEKSIESGLQIAKVSKSTFYRWLHESERFRTEYERQKRELVNTALDTLRGNLQRAVNTFVGLLDSENENIKYQVAYRVIEQVLKLKELSEIDDRLGNLEKMIVGK